MAEAGREVPFETRYEDNTRGETTLATVVREDEIPEIGQFVARPETPLLVIISGPSGVGKDVTLQRMQEMGYPFHYTVTVTTRPIRPGEIDGLHYHFRTIEQFQTMLAADQLLESSTVYGNYYGVPRSEVQEHLAKGEDVIIKPDVQGAEKIRKYAPNAIYIFLAPPSMTELEERLRKRNTEDPKALALRLGIARQEMKELPKYDYVVVNDAGKLDRTVEKIAAIMAAEKLRVYPRQIVV